MSAILDRLLSTGDFEVVIFGDKVIFDEPIEHWVMLAWLKVERQIKYHTN